MRVLEWTTGRLQRAAIESARLEAQVLLAHVLSSDRVSLYTNYDKPLSADELAAYRSLIQRRLQGHPVAYLVGEQEFWSLSFSVDPSVLIPRRDTETAIEVVLDAIEDRQAVLYIADIATGSGAIAVTLASELPNARVVATDVSERALAVCRHNAERHALAERVETRLGDGFDAMRDREMFDIVVSNPPYIPSADIEGLSPEVQSEPRLALDGGHDGLHILRRLIADAPDHLAPHGRLVLEHGFDQAKAVTDLFECSQWFEPPETRRDMGANPRVTSACKRA